MTLQRLLQAAFWGAVALTFVSAELPQDVAPQLPFWDKAVHFSCFLALALLGALAHPRRRLPAIALGLALFGALIEVVQALPSIHRDADPLDWIADVLGVALACATLRLFGLPKSRRVGEPGG